MLPTQWYSLKKEVFIAAISGQAGHGYTVPFEQDDAKRLLEANTEWMNLHSEIKVLNQIVREVEKEVEGDVYLFSERKPCSSCKKVINQFRGNEQINLELVVTHDPEMEEGT